MDTEEKFRLIVRNTEEVLTEEDLRTRLETGVRLKHYIGFEISGKVHLGTGFVCMSKVKDLLDAGADCTIFLADWHTWINDKLGGDREVIRRMATGYFQQGLVAGLKCLGADPDKVKFVLGTDLYHQVADYWETFVDITKNTTLGRVQRSITIMGRKEGESVDLAKLLYAPMQVADIFSMEINLPHAGLDQRKAHVIARDVAHKMKFNPLLDQSGNKIKPVAIHGHLILGLQKPPIWPVPKDQLQEVWSSMKMSKSIPKSAVFIHDEPETIQKNLNSAFCPQGEVEFNPVLDWAKYLIFGTNQKSLLIERKQKFGGDIEFFSYSELEQAFINKELHPLDMKRSIANKLIGMLEPARRHFNQPSIKKMKEELEELTLTR
ncbi:MAG: tyrosine--tRNA ligase [Candidatus Hodarchaeales archaeon]|jgi:tyrosyl-tRNA synthetase